MLNARVTRMFFDKPAVMRAVDRATRRVLSRFGAYVRRTARQSIRRRKGPSAPGQPPSSHTGLLKDFIFFAYEPAKEDVVIGPAKLNRGTNAPELLEEGGTVITKRPRWIPTGKTRADGRPKRIRVPAGTTLTYEARPYMGPAFRENLPKLDEFWRNSVR